MGMLMKNGVPYASGSEIPEGGTKGQVLAKASDISGDFEWVNGGGDGGGNATFDVATIPQGPTSAHEIIAIVSNADSEYARLSYIRQSDGTLPNAVNLGVKSGLGDDSFELPTKAYVNSKALSPTGWGVVRTGVATVEFNNSKWSSSATVDVSELGFSSGADYDVVAQPTTGGTATPWGNAIAFVNADKGASSFSVSSVTMEESLSGTVNVKYTIFAKGYGAVAYTGEIPTGGTTGQILTKRSDTDGDYGWQTHGAWTKDGDWWYKINPDNTFEAFYSKTKVTLTIQDTSGNFYRSALQTLTLPTGIKDRYDATPLHASVNASHNNYPCFGTLASVETNQIKYYALSGGSRSASPNYTVTAHVFGTLAAKA